jgi:hypothetical protein
MTATGAALRPLVDALLAEPLDTLGVEALQARIAAVTPSVARLQGWLSAAAGRLEQTSGGTVPDADGRARTTAGWLTDVQHTTASTAGSGLRTARPLRSMPLVTNAVLDAVLTPAQAAVLTRLVDKIEPEALLEAQPAMILVAAAMDPAQLGMWVTHQIATHCEPVLDTAEARGQDQRYLTHRREQDGTLHGRFVLSPEDSEVLLTALEPLARRAGDDDRRTAGQRRPTRWSPWPSRSCGTARCPTPVAPVRNCPTSCPPTGPPPDRPRPPARSAARAVQTTSR